MRTSEQLEKARKIIISHYDLFKSLFTDEQVNSWVDIMLNRIEAEETAGYGEKEIADNLGFGVTNLRALKAIEGENRRKLELEQATRYKDLGLTNAEIAKLLDKKESYIRALFMPIRGPKQNTQEIVNLLRKNVDRVRYLDIGSGAEKYLGVKRATLHTVIEKLKEEGYKVQYVKIPKLGTNLMTACKVLTSPDVSFSELDVNKYKIQIVRME